MTRFYSSTAQPTTLSAGCTNSATSIQVTATTGFPAAEFILALDYGTAQQELVKVTAVAGTTLTVVRGFDSTTAQAHSLGAVVRHVHSADDFRLSRTHEAASSGVHGATGALVGTTDAQALTNKDLTSGTNTFPASLATDAELSAHASATATHGVSGAIVGTSDAQTLTNKTVNLTSNTLTGTTAQFNTALSDGDFATLAGAETLTNKTVSLGSNSVSGTTAQFNAANTDGDFATLAGGETLTNKTLSTGTKVGAATTDISGAWTAYSPTWVGVTVGNGTVVAEYVQIGKTVHFRIELTLGSTTALGGVQIVASLPVAATSFRWRFNGEILDAATANYPIHGRVVPTASTSNVEFVFRNTSSLVDSQVTGATGAPFLMGTGDTLSINGTYEAA